MQPASSNDRRGGAYDAFGCRVQTDRPIPFERTLAGQDDLQLILDERSDLISRIGCPSFTCFHDAEDFPGGPRLKICRGEDAFIVEHRDFLLRFLPAQNRIEYRIRFERNEQFRFGLMVERIAIPLFLLLTRPNLLGIHGGAVALDGNGWAFIGPSGVGKSTTARTLLRHDAQLLADDLTLINAQQHKILPGCPAVRLWQDAGTVGEAIHDAQLTEQVRKRWFRIGRRHVHSDDVSLGGIVVLDPLPPDDTTPQFTYEHLRGQEAFAAVMRQVFNFSDPDPAFATRQFRNVKALLTEHRVIRFSYRRSQSGAPTHVEPLLEVLQDLASDTPDDSDRP